MKKLLLIIQREYLTRVKKRSFILATLLTPLAFALFFVIVAFIFSYEGDGRQRIAVIDQGNMLDNRIKDSQNLYFKFVKDDLETVKETLEDEEYSGVLVIPKLKKITNTRHTVFYYSDDQPSLDVVVKIEKAIGTRIRDYKIDALQLDREELKSLDTKVVLDPEPLAETDSNASTMTGAIGAGIGGVMGFIMYMAVFIYGMMVMRSVMEEKVNRIVEVMISSVKPFQLMLGKIIGVGGVGLTQVAIWAVLIPIMYLLVMLVFGVDPSAMDASAAAVDTGQVDIEELESQIFLAMKELNDLNWWLIIPLFIFYFLGGYFLYASLFAAVGSAMGDDLGEGQALTIPISIPVIIAFYIMIVVVRSPQSNLAIWSSIFPLFSPIVMPARLAFDPPWWQIVASVVTLIVAVLFFVWLSGRIYRVGILMYGKKITFKELGRWIFSR